MKPITVEAAESDPQYAYEDGDGTMYDHYDLTFTPENWERIRQGWACLRCWELQTVGLLIASTDKARRTPEKHLPGCVYAPHGIMERQQADIAKEFYGNKWVGPKAKLEDTLREDDERRAKYRRDTGRKAGASVPPWVKL